MRTRIVLASLGAAAVVLALIVAGPQRSGAPRRDGTALYAASAGAPAGTTTTGTGARTGATCLPSPCSRHLSTGTATSTGSTTGTGTTTGAGTITTTGTGTVSGSPDTMTVTIGVSTSGSDASAALAHNNAVAAAVQGALEKDGVAAQDIQTSGLSLGQTYSPNPPGYQADDEVTASLHDLAKAGATIDDAVAAAGNAGRLNGVAFSMSDTSPLMATARRQAVAAAETQAQQLAAAAGVHLGPLASLSDQSQQSYPVPYAFRTAADAAAAPAVPLRPGTQQLSVDVTAVWDIIP